MKADTTTMTMTAYPSNVSSPELSSSREEAQEVEESMAELWVQEI